MNNVQALLLRPRIQAEQTARDLQFLHIDSFIEPMCEISYQKAFSAISPDLNRSETVFIVTSCHALPALHHFPAETEIITVGEETAKLAFARGFSNVHVAQGNAYSIEQLIKNTTTLRHKKFCYLSGNIIASNITVHLQQAGISSERRIVYHSLPVQRFSQRLTKKLFDRDFNLILFFSVETAKTFTQNLQRVHLFKSLEESDAFCLSPRIADSVKSLQLPVKNIYSASQPHSKFLLHAIKHYLNL